MRLITKSLEKRFEKVGNQINTSNPIVICKFFVPRNLWTRYLTEYYPDAKVCYGYIVGTENERGYVAVPELEKIFGPSGLRIERDLFFEEIFFNDLKKKL